MLTRNDIDIRIDMMRKQLSAEPQRSENERKLAAMFDVGLALLGNFLGDISDIARAHRYNSATAFRDRADEH